MAESKIARSLINIKSRNHYSQSTTLTEMLNGCSLGLTMIPIWNDDFITDFPSGLNGDRLILFVKGSVDNYYNKIIIFSSAVIKIGYFASGTTLTWRTVTTT